MGLLEAAKQALEALEIEMKGYAAKHERLMPAAHALRTAIAEAEKQEPGVRPCHVFNVKKTGPLTEWEPTSMALALPDGNHALYTTPLATQRQPLTDEEIERATGCDRNKPLWIAIESVARAIEAAHGIKEKNT